MEQSTQRASRQGIYFGAKEINIGTYLGTWGFYDEEGAFHKNYCPVLRDNQSEAIKDAIKAHETTTRGR